MDVGPMTFFSTTPYGKGDGKSLLWLHYDYIHDNVWYIYKALSSRGRKKFFLGDFKEAVYCERAYEKCHLSRNCRWLLEAENSGPQLTNNKKTDTSVLQFQELNCANKHMSMEKDPTSNKTTAQADTSDCSLWKAGQRTQLICAWINMCFLSHWICYNLVHSNRE